MARDYLSIRPVQQIDPTSCWAACLEWWARAIGNRTVVTQVNLLNQYHTRWDSRETLPDGDNDPNNDPPNPDYGTVSKANLLAIIRDTQWHMNAEVILGRSFTTTYINQKMRHGPCIVGYYEPAVSGNHVVVVYGASQTHVACMNPDGAHFQGRRVAVYSDSSEVVIGWPTQ